MYGTVLLKREQNAQKKGKQSKRKKTRKKRVRDISLAKASRAKFWVRFSFWRRAVRGEVVGEVWGEVFDEVFGLVLLGPRDIQSKKLQQKLQAAIPFGVITRMKLLLSSYLGDHSYSFQGSCELISITVTISLFF